MKMTMIRCDGPKCTSSRADEPLVSTDRWMLLNTATHDGPELHFCSRNCVARWAGPSVTDSDTSDPPSGAGSEPRPAIGSHHTPARSADVYDTSPGRWRRGRGIGFQLIAGDAP